MRILAIAAIVLLAACVPSPTDPTPEELRSLVCVPGPDPFHDLGCDSDSTVVVIVISNPGGGDDDSD